MMKSRATVIALLLTTLAGCGGAGDSSTAEKPENTPTTTLEASPEPDDSTIPSTGAEPNVGDGALRVGDWREGLYTRTRLSEIRFPYPPGEYRVPEAGKQFVGFRAQQCVRGSFDQAAKEENGGDLLGTFNGEWYVSTPSGEQVTSSSSWNDWPSPKFPENVTIPAGQCIKGWLTIEVPKGTRIEKVIWRPGGETIAEWLP